MVVKKFHLYDNTYLVILDDLAGECIVDNNKLIHFNTYYNLDYFINNYYKIKTCIVNSEYNILKEHFEISNELIREYDLR